MADIDVDDLTDGDVFHDAEGFERYDEIVVVRADPTATPAIAPTSGYGEPIESLKTPVDPDEFQSRIDSGRYVPIDVDALETLDRDALALPEEEAYIRFGDVPRDERSCYEDGVSVYDATVVAVGPDVDAPGMYVPLGNDRQITMLSSRDTYLVTGKVVGRGGDGEPLLRDVEVIADLDTEDGLAYWVAE